MKQVVIRQTGGLEELETVERELPAPGPGQVRLRSLAIGVNFGDILIRRGVYPVQSPFPFTPGFELVGEVSAIGNGVEGIRLGERFAAMTIGGAYAEEVVVDATQLLHAPTTIPPEQVVGALAQGLTAWGLLDLASVGKEESILVHSAASGVGNLLVQLAKLRGVGQVMGATGQSKKLDPIRTAGADHVLNYSEAGWSNAVRDLTDGRGVDVLFDAVGGDVRDAGLSALAAFGRAILYGTSSGQMAGLSAEQLMGVIMGNQSIAGFAILDYMSARPDFLSQAWEGLTGALVGNQLRIKHRSFPLEEARAAQATMEQRETIGKLVLVP